MRSRRLLALLGSLLLVMPLTGSNAAGWIGVRLEGDVLQVAVPACVEQPTRIIVSLIHDDYDPDDDPDASTRRVERKVWRAEGPLTLPEAQGEYRVIPLDESLSPDTNGNYQGALEALDLENTDLCPTRRW